MKKFPKEPSHPNALCQVPVACPECKAPAGQRCVNTSNPRKKRKQHAERRQLANQRS